MTDEELEQLHFLACKYRQLYWRDDSLDDDAWTFFVAIKDRMLSRGLLENFWDRTPAAQGRNP